jgi:hypothetical protein
MPPDSLGYYWAKELTRPPEVLHNAACELVDAVRDLASFDTAATVTVDEIDQLIEECANDFLVATRSFGAVFAVGVEFPVTTGPARLAIRDTFSVLRLRDIFFVALPAFAFEEVLRVENLGDVTGAVFGAVVAFAALLVPAATLVREHVRSVQHAVVERVIDPQDQPSDEELEKRRKAYYAMLGDLDLALAPLLRGFAYGMLAVPFGAIALVRPQLSFGHWPAWWLHHRTPPNLEIALIGFCLALLLAAVLSFYPLTWVMIRRQNLISLRAELATPFPSQDTHGTVGGQPAHTALKTVSAILLSAVGATLSGRPCAGKEYKNLNVTIEQGGCALLPRRVCAFGRRQLTTPWRSRSYVPCGRRRWRVSI